MFLSSRMWFQALCVASLVVACSGSSGSPNGPGALPDGGEQAPVTEGGAPADAATGTSANGELSILSLTPTSPTMTGGAPLPTESLGVTFIAIVTDAAGLDAIAGGQLMDDSGATFAAFGAGANKGTYSATLDWATMNTIHAAEFDEKGGTRTFVAKFFDNHKNEATAKVDIKLACRSATAAKELLPACGGACSDITRDAKNCGACGNSCTSTSCVASKCAVTFTPDPANPQIVQTDCLAPSAFAAGTTCTSLCLTRGGTSACTRTVNFSAADATCGGASTDGTCETDLSKAAGPLRCRCSN
jgi:Stigma-specific protein, Stig1